MSLAGRPARWVPWALLVLALAVRLATAWPLQQPGYTDAYYYATGARQLASGQGFGEPFIWNYLDPPDGLPHPGYLYWMPLAAILGWGGHLLLGDSFGALQAPFALLSALLPLVAYGVAWDLTGKQKHALLAGLLVIFPGFYIHRLVLPDSFAPFALAGSLCLWMAGRGLCERRPLWFGLAGLAAGFGHLARADGLLLAGVALISAAVLGLPSFYDREDNSNRARAVLGSLALAAGGYLLVMGPWFARTWMVAGTPLAGTGARTLFLTTYDDIFGYGRPLTLEGYLAWGWGEILKSKAQALLLNLQRLWAEGLLIVLLPFSALGLWNLRRERVVWPFCLYLPLLFVTMTFAFTFPGTRGGLFHSGGALLPFFAAAAGPGLESVLRWAARRFQSWQVRKAWPVFGAGLVGMALLLSAFALARDGVLDGGWKDRNAGYAEIGEWLTGQEGGSVVVMVGNAPGFTWHTGRPAIAVPNEALETILAVADRYGARYLVLDGARPRTTDDLYNAEATHPRLALRFVSSEERPRQVYEILGAENS